MVTIILNDGQVLTEATPVHGRPQIIPGGGFTTSEDGYATDRIGPNGENFYPCEQVAFVPYRLYVEDDRIMAEAY